MLLLTESPHYHEILREYNALIEKQGKVNNSKFFLNNVQPRVPEISYQIWYSHLQRIARKSGQVTIVPHSGSDKQKLIQSQEKQLEGHLQKTSENTQVSIAGALAVGRSAIEEILENPMKLSISERMKIFFDAMKAQDSRIRAIAEIKKDAREEKAFAKAFEDATFEGIAE